MTDKTDEFEVIRKWGDRLKELWPRDPNGELVNQKTWAEEIGVSSSNLGSYLRGGQSPNLFIVIKIRTWMKNSGYPDSDFLWLMDGGPRPPKPGGGSLKAVGGRQGRTAQSIKKLTSPRAF